MIKEVELNKQVEQILLELSEIWEKENNLYGYRANTLEDIINKRVFFAYDENDRVVGYLFGHSSLSENMTSVMPNGQRVFEIDELYVTSENRSQGVGKQLFQYVESIMKKDHSYLLLSTSTKNYKAILHFYIEEVDMTFWSARLFKKL